MSDYQPDWKRLIVVWGTMGNLDDLSGAHYSYRLLVWEFGNGLMAVTTSYN